MPDALVNASSLRGLKPVGNAHHIDGAHRHGLAASVLGWTSATVEELCSRQF